MPQNTQWRQMDDEYLWQKRVRPEVNIVDNTLK